MFQGFKIQDTEQTTGKKRGGGEGDTEQRYKSVNKAGI